MEHKLLMVLGPTEVERDILEIASQPQEYMRTDDYTSKWLKIFEGLKYCFQTKNTVVVTASSGTGVMEAAVTNFLSKNDTAIYINGGSFGKRWGDICKKHKINTVEISVPFGESPNPKIVEQTLNRTKNPKVVFATLNETSSGALTDIKSIGEIIKQFPETLFIVDCVSGLLADEFLQDEWGVDVAISASQKAFALPPGLGFISANEKALEFAQKSDLRNFYFDIFDYINNAKRGQTPFTPAVSLVNQLDKRLEKIQKEGLKNFRTRYKKNTEILRKGLELLDFKLLANTPANCVSAVMTNDIDASLVVKIMREKYNIEIAPSGGDLKTKLFRIGNYGDVGEDEINQCLNALKKVKEELYANESLHR